MANQLGYLKSTKEQLAKVDREKNLSLVVGRVVTDPLAKDIPSNPRAFFPDCELDYQVDPDIEESSLEGSSFSEVADSMALEAKISGGAGLFAASAECKMRRHGFSTSSTFYTQKKMRYVQGQIVLKQFPPPFDKLQPEFKKDLLDGEPHYFFKKYGPLVVKGLQIGGYYDMHMTTSSAGITSSSELEAAVAVKYGTLCDGSVNFAMGHSDKVETSSVKMQVHFHGGDTTLYKPTKPFAEQTEWINSLMTHPTCAYMYTAPIWHLLPFEHSARAQQLEEFAEKLTKEEQAKKRRKMEVERVSLKHHWVAMKSTATGLYINMNIGRKFDGGMVFQWNYPQLFAIDVESGGDEEFVATIKSQATNLWINMNIGQHRNGGTIFQWNYPQRFKIKKVDLARFTIQSEHDPTYYVNMDTVQGRDGGPVHQWAFPQEFILELKDRR